MEITTAERYASGGPGREPESSNVYEAFLKTVARIGEDVALRTEDDSVSITWNELSAWVSRIAGGLEQLGLQKGETVALMLNNRPEFIPCDLAAVSLGGVPFSIYQTSSPEQIAYVVSDAGSRIAIIESAFLEPFSEARKSLPGIEHLIVIDGEGGTGTLEDLEAANPGFDPAERAAEVGLDDLLTLIYTSGTTGPPKGVQLTHRNLMALTSGVEGMVELPKRGGRLISWLPAAHIAERGAHYYLPVVNGLTVTICPDPRRIVEFIPKVKPSWFFAVPRIYEKLKAGLEAQLAGLPDEQRVPAEKGLEAAIAKVRLEQAGEEVPEELAAAVARADEELFSKLRAALGLDELQAVNVGAAPTPLEVLEFFHAIGIPVGELWGMSETCGVATLNPPERIKLGTVGPPVPGVEIKLADDGEVMVKGDGVMPGLPQHAREDRRDLRGRLAAHRRHRRARLRWLPEDRRPQEGADHQRGRQEHVAGQHRVEAEGRRPVDRPVRRDRRRPPLQRRPGRPRPRLRAGLGGRQRARGHRRSPSWRATSGCWRRWRRGSRRPTRRWRGSSRSRSSRSCRRSGAPGGDELTPTMKLKRKPIAEKYALRDRGALLQLGMPARC